MSPELIQNSILTTVMLLARIIGVFIYAPGFSSKSIPKRFKVLLALALSAILSRFITYTTIDTPYIFLVYICCEFTAGFMVGFIANAFIYTIQCVGGVIDNLLGTGMFQAADMNGAMSSMSSKLIENLGLLVFFVSNSHLYLMYVITRESNFINIFESFRNDSFVFFVVEILHFIFINGVHLATPFILIFLLVDIFLGIMNRSFSTFNIFLFSMPVKIFLFIITLLYYISTFTLNLENLMTMNIDLLNSFILFINPR